MSSDTTLRGIGQKSSTGDAPRDKAATASGAAASKDVPSAKPGDVKPGDVKSGQAKPGDVKIAEAKPGDAKLAAAGKPQSGAGVNPGKPAGVEPRRSEIRPSLGAPLGGPLRSLDSTVPGARSLDSSVPGAPASLDAKVPNLAATLIGVAAPALGPALSLFGNAKTSDPKDQTKDQTKDATKEPMLPGVTPAARTSGSGIPIKRDASTTIGNDLHLTNEGPGRASGRVSP